MDNKDKVSWSLGFTGVVLAFIGSALETTSVILTGIFVVAKLAGGLGWPWIGVFMPVIISTGLGILSLLVAASVIFLQRDNIKNLFGFDK